MMPDIKLIEHEAHERLTAREAAEETKRIREDRQEKAEKSRREKTRARKKKAEQVKARKMLDALNRKAGFTDRTRPGNIEIR